MKTAEEIFDFRYGNEMDVGQLRQALKEYNEEIVKLIDDMTKAIDTDMEKDYGHLTNLPDNAFNHLVGYKKALTELKNAINNH